MLCAELSCLRAVEIRQCDELTSAATIGWRQPVLLLPGDWKNWTAEQRRAVLAHEIAHVRGRDFLALLFGQLGLALHFYHPLLHWLTNRMRLEQELAADAAAARISGGQRQYLTTIAELALHQTERPLFWPARTFLPTQNTFLRRIAMLRNTKIRFERLSPYSRLIAVGTVLLCGFAVSGLRGPVSQGRVLADDAQGNQSVAKAVEISAVANQPTESQKVIGYVGESSADYRSFADSGFAVEYERPEGMNSVSAVKIFSARYGYPQAPNEDFHIYLLDGNKKVLEDIRVPYRKVERGELQWNTFRFPAVQVPEKFYVALWFNAQRTKGVYVGMDKNVSETHSFAGLPDKGYEKVEENYEWMIRAVVSSETGKTPSNPKVKTYEEEKAADTESTEAASDESGSETPTRTWNDATGTFSMEAQFLGVSDGKVNLKKADGKLVEIPLDKLSQEDRDFVAESCKQHAENEIEGNRRCRRQAARTVTRRRQNGQQIEHRRRRACGEVPSRFGLLLCDFGELARLALWRGPAAGRGFQRLDLRRAFQAPRDVSFPLQFLHAKRAGVEEFPHRADEGAAEIHRLLRIQSRSHEGSLCELRRPGERKLARRPAGTGRTETVRQGRLADPLQGGEAGEEIDGNNFRHSFPRRAWERVFKVPSLCPALLFSGRHFQSVEADLAGGAEEADADESFAGFGGYFDAASFFLPVERAAPRTNGLLSDRGTILVVEAEYHGGLVKLLRFRVRDQLIMDLLPADIQGYVEVLDFPPIDGERLQSLTVATAYGIEKLDVLLSLGRGFVRDEFELPRVVPCNRFRRVTDRLFETAILEFRIRGIGLHFALASALPVIGTKIVGRKASCSSLPSTFFKRYIVC